MGSKLTLEEEQCLDKLDAYALCWAGLAHEIDGTLNQFRKRPLCNEDATKELRYLYEVRTKLNDLLREVKETDCPTRCVEAVSLCAYSIKAMGFWTDCLAGYLTLGERVLKNATDTVQPVVKQVMARFDELCLELDPARYKDAGYWRRTKEGREFVRALLGRMAVPNMEKGGGTTGT